LSKISAGELLPDEDGVEACRGSGQKRHLSVQTCERKIGLAALVPIAQRDKTEVPGAAAARFLRQTRESNNRTFRGGSTRRASSHSLCPSEHDLNAVLGKFCGDVGGRGDMTAAYGEMLCTSAWSRSTIRSVATER